LISCHPTIEGTGEGYLDLLRRLLGEGLQVGDPAYGQERYAVDLDAEALGHQGMTELVQEHAEEKRHYNGRRRERPSQAARTPVA
jgi:hypothetical protein